MIIPYTLKNLGLNKVCLWGFPGGASGKKNLPTSAGNVRDTGLILAREDPMEKEMATHYSILAGEAHGQGRLAGYGP